MDSNSSGPWKYELVKLKLVLFLKFPIPYFHQCFVSFSYICQMSKREIVSVAIHQGNSLGKFPRELPREIPLGNSLRKFQEIPEGMGDGHGAFGADYSRNHNKGLH